MSNRFFLILRFIVLVILIIIVLFPYIWMFLNSFKSSQELVTYPIVWFPKSLSLDGYRELFREVKIQIFFKNSLIVCVASTLTSVIVTSLAAFALARIRFKQRFMTNAIIISIILVFQLIPPVVLLIPLYFNFLRLNLVDSHIGLIIAYLVFSIPFSILMLRNYFVTVYPKELDEAAMVDGCNYFQVFYKITLPLCKPGIAAVGTFTFMLSWNDFIWSSILINTFKLKTLNPALFLLFGDQVSRIMRPSIFAGALIVAFPTFLMFFFLQKYLVLGLGQGAVKG